MFPIKGILARHKKEGVSRTSGNSVVLYFWRTEPQGVQMVDFQSEYKLVSAVLKTAEQAWNLLLRVTQANHGIWARQHYEIFSRNWMEMDAKSIETQSRLRKNKTVWRVQFEGRPLWVQIQTFWSLPAGTPLYVCRTVKNGGRQKRVLFRTNTGARELWIWAETLAPQSAVTTSAASNE